MFITTLLFIACSGDSSSDRNPFLQEIGFRFEINLNLPLYNSLNTIGNAVYIGNSGVGTRGIFVINTGLGNNPFFAWEASCPNHAPNNCSTMTIDGGTNCVCACEDYEYSLFNGQLLSEPQAERTYGLLNYRTTIVGDIVTISN